MTGHNWSTLIVPPTRLTTVGDRAFPVVAARVWNGLSPDVTKDADLEALSLHPLFFITDYWLRRPRHCLHSRDASRLNCLHGTIAIAPAASDFPFRLLVDAVTHVLSVFRVCKVP